MNDTKKISMSIFLLKRGVSPEKALKEEVRGELEGFEKISSWKVLVRNNPPFAPDWADCIGTDVRVSSASAVLFIRGGNLWFAACFGYGHNFLDKSKVVSDFGLRTALNALDKDRIKSSDIFSPSDHSKQRRTQTVADSSMQGHDIDGYSHILKRITGRVQERYEELFRTITASSESIKISVPGDVDEWEEICSKLHAIYSRDEFEKNFPEVFHLRPVEDKETEDALFEHLIEQIDRQSEEVCLEIPELVDFQEASDFRIIVKDRKKHVFSCEDLSIKKLYGIMSGLGKAVELEDLGKWELILLDVNGKRKRRFGLLECLVFECEIGNREYHFSHARWYGINQEFSQQLKKIDDLLRHEINGTELPAYRHQDENDYNRKLAGTLGGFCLDRKMISMHGYDKIELCDVLLVEDEAGNERKNMLVHVKRKHGGSSGLSHLFQQGSVSLTLLNSGNEKFLEGVRQLKPDFNESLPALVHYVIIVDRPGDSIPLFARISLFKTIEEIQSKRGEICWSIVCPQADSV